MFFCFVVRHGLTIAQTGTHCIVLSDWFTNTSLSLLPRHRDCRCEPLCLTSQEFFVLGMKHRASQMHLRCNWALQKPTHGPLQGFFVFFFKLHVFGVLPACPRCMPSAWESRGVHWLLWSWRYSCELLCGDWEPRSPGRTASAPNPEPFLQLSVRFLRTMTPHFFFRDS